MKSTFVTIIATAASLITFFVARRIFQNELKLGSPSLLAALVAGLTFLGLTTGGQGIASALLIPHEALAITLLILFLLFWIARRVKSRANRVRTPDEADGRNAKRHWGSSPDRESPSQPPKTRLPRGHPRRPGSTDYGTRESQASASDASRPEE